VTGWLVAQASRVDCRVRLFCLPFAGGGARVFRDWPAGLPADVEVWAVLPPGRERRLAEAALERVDELAGHVAEAMEPLLDRPFALFGHSVGAVVAFEVVRRLRARGLAPVHFIASACRAPQLPSRQRLHVLPDEEMLEGLRSRGGLSDEVLRERELVSLLLPALRADVRMYETYRYAPQAPFPWPLTAVGGIDDDRVTRADLEAWSIHAGGRFAVRQLPGDHFFLRSAEPELLRLIGGELDEGRS
jgi:medium-chain acyl-[acyl-carrier-protein] hydrolase